MVLSEELRNSFSIAFKLMSLASQERGHLRTNVSGSVLLRVAGGGRSVMFHERHRGNDICVELAGELARRCFRPSKQ